MYLLRERATLRRASGRFTLPAQPALVAFVALFLAAHLAIALSAGLAVDEAHYALYAQHLDWSYFDHPPLVGWLQLPALWAGGSNLAMRCMPIADWLATLWFARALAAELFPSLDSRRIPDAATWLILAAPMFQLLGVALLPDSLLLPLTCAVMAFTWRLREAEECGRPWNWIGLGMALGLAGLSKYTAIFLAIGAAGVLVGRHGRRLCLASGPWIAAAIALVLVAPVFLWNERHGWASIGYQARHAFGGQDEGLGGIRAFLGYHPARPAPAPAAGWTWSRAGAAEVIQLIAYGPLLAFGVARAWRRWRGHPAVGFSLAFALPPLAVIAALAGFGGSLPHWAGFAWMALVPMAAAGLANAWRSPVARPWTRVLAGTQLALCLSAFACAFVGAVPGLGAAANPFADFYGWAKAGAEARVLAAEYHAPGLAVSNWTLASRLAWYARPMPVHVLDSRHDQFSLWYGKQPVGASAVLVEWSHLDYALPLAHNGSGGFASCRRIGSFRVVRFGRELSRFDFYLATDWRGPVAPVRK